MLSDPRPVVICYYFHYLPGNWVWLQFLCAVKIWGDLPCSTGWFEQNCFRSQCWPNVQGLVPGVKGGGGHRADREWEVEDLALAGQHLADIQALHCQGGVLFNHRSHFLVFFWIKRVNLEKTDVSTCCPKCFTWSWSWTDVPKMAHPSPHG